MSQFKTWTDQTAKATDTAFTPGVDQEIRITGSFTQGYAWLESKATGESAYSIVPGTKMSAPNKFKLAVPDGTVSYQFVCQNIVGTVNCYAGP